MPQAGDYTAEMVGAMTQTEADERYLQLNGGQTAAFELLGDEVVIGTPSYSEALMISGGGGSITLQAEDIYMTGALDMGYCKITNLDEPFDDTDAATKGYVDSISSGGSQSTTVTLTTAGWTASGSLYTQTVTVNGVVADESAQLIMPMPAIASQADYISAGIYCSGQAANQLTFTCTTVPTNDISMYVVLQGVGA